MFKHELPEGVESASELEFPNAVPLPKNPSGMRGAPKAIGRNHGALTVMSYPARQYGSGREGNLNARWRKGKSLGHGPTLNTKFVKGR